MCTRIITNKQIGIVTYHKANNYGAVLQAFALEQYLNKFCEDVSVIDYWPRHHALVFKAWTGDWQYYLHSPLKRKFTYLIKMIFLFIKRIIRNHNFDVFRSSNMRMTPMDDYVFNGVFYGSDTIWNQWNHGNVFHGFDKMYWGDAIIKAKHKFSYAPSMGNVITTDESRNYCFKMLKNFEKISVRESQLLDFVKSLGYNSAITVADPTLLLTTDEWNNFVGKRIVRQDYILCYNLERSSIIYEIAKRLSKKYKLKVIYLSIDAELTLKRNHFDLAGPQHFLSLYKYAKYVVTSSFHGVVFSLIFHKPFVFNSNFETERISSILDTCNLSQRFVYDSELNIIETPIDYDIVDQNLSNLRKKSYQYIESCLDVINND